MQGNNYQFYCHNYGCNKMLQRLLTDYQWMIKGWLTGKQCFYPFNRSVLVHFPIWGHHHLQMADLDNQLVQYPCLTILKNQKLSLLRQLMLSVFDLVRCLVSLICETIVLPDFSLKHANFWNHFNLVRNLLKRLQRDHSSSV